MLIINGLYKVTNRGNCSALNYRLAQFSIQYEINEWIKPKIGKIFVFCDKQMALNWITLSSRYRYKLWKCQAINLSRQDTIVHWDYLDHLREFWKNKICKDIIPPPSGTLFAEQIRLVEEIEL